jgi:ribosomal protein S18 acetylase RimI-like enzyme
MAITITVLTPEQEEKAVGLLARAFVTNPLHVAVFGTDQISANEAFFRIGLAVMKGQKLVAADGPRILGVIHWVDSAKCQFSSAEKLRMLPAMVKGFGLSSAIRVGGWLSVWSKHDPMEHHVHLGPIGVSPEAQGRGVGRQLMQQYCGHLDDRGAVGYLETDRPENVEIYTKFGFDVTEAASIHGITNYFMRRGAQDRITTACR